MARDVTKTKLQLEPHQIILRPIVTEKSFHQAEAKQKIKKTGAEEARYNSYTFEVNRLASKADVRRAVEELFEVRVVRVNTANFKGKPRRVRFRQGYTKAWKKAVVKLHPEDRISFF